MLRSKPIKQRKVNTTSKLRKNITSRKTTRKFVANTRPKKLTDNDSASNSFKDLTALEKENRIL